MTTIFLLMAQYGGRPIIPLADVHKDFFPHIDLRKLQLKCATGEIKLPLVRTDPSSQKSMRGVAVQDLADYLDSRRAAAVKEMEQLRAA